MTGFDRVRAALEDADLIVPSWGGGVSFKCPAHDDGKASGTLGENDRSDALVYCHAGCSTKEILAALDLEMYHLFSDEDVETETMEHGVRGDNRTIAALYVYTDEQGEPLIQVTRTEPKGFYQSHWEDGQWVAGLSGARRVIYNLPSVRTAVTSGATVFLVEGEKDADALTARGCVATTKLGGATAVWQPEWCESLRGANIVIIPDLDEPGWKAAEQARRELRDYAKTISIKTPAVGKDISDHLSAGHSLSELVDYDSAGNVRRIRWGDWEEEAPEVSWLYPGIIPKGALIWAYGSKETAKSMWTLWLGAMLSRTGHEVAFFSEDQPAQVDRRRLPRLRVDKQHFHWANSIGLDLSQEKWVEDIIEDCMGYDLIIIDTYSKAWRDTSTNENDRATECALVCNRITRETGGATIIMIDHTGFPWRDDRGDQHDQRQPRGASAKEQAVDMSILFTSEGTWAGPNHDYFFTMDNMKPARYENPFKLRWVVEDTEFGWLSCRQRDGGFINARGLGEDDKPERGEAVEPPMTSSSSPGIVAAVGPGRESNQADDSVPSEPSVMSETSRPAAARLEEGAVADASSGEYSEDDRAVGVAEESPQVSAPSSMTIEEQLALARLEKWAAGEG